MRSQSRKRDCFRFAAKHPDSFETQIREEDVAA
jgi:hypothetical protein